MMERRRIQKPFNHQLRLKLPACSFPLKGLAGEKLPPCRSPSPCEPHALVSFLLACSTKVPSPTTSPSFSAFSSSNSSPPLTSSSSPSFPSSPPKSPFLASSLHNHHRHHHLYRASHSSPNIASAAAMDTKKATSSISAERDRHPIPARSSTPPRRKSSSSSKRPVVLPPLIHKLAQTVCQSATCASAFKDIQSKESQLLLDVSEVQLSKSAQRSNGATPNHSSIGKNRYMDVLPFEYNRIKLADGGSSLLESDYINASPIQFPQSTGKSTNKKHSTSDSFSRSSYIATQGPLPSTTGDFWSMAMQQKCKIILMLTKLEDGGMIKCHQYYPSRHSLDNNTTSMFFSRANNSVIEVLLLSETNLSTTHPNRNEFSSSPNQNRVEILKSFEDYLSCKYQKIETETIQTLVRHLQHMIVRKFKVVRKATSSSQGGVLEESDKMKSNSAGGVDTFHGIIDEMETIQIQYMGWPDHGVPDQPESLIVLSEFVEFLKSQDQSQISSSPTVQSADHFDHPVLVHCSAGVGRTGTFITLHYLTTQLWKSMISLSPHSISTTVQSHYPPEDHYMPPLSSSTSFNTSSPSTPLGQISLNVSDDLVLECVQHLRKCRKMMVQTLQQFQFCYVAIISWWHLLASSSQK